MYTLGIPKSQYRRTTQVLGFEASKPIPYDAVKQEDGFYIFSFPGADEMDFRKIVRLLKVNGITTIGADDQLTERQIMKLADLLKEESTGAFGATSEELADMYSLKMLQQFRDEVMMDMKQKDGPMSDMYRGQLNGLDKAIAIKKGKMNEGTCGYSVDGKPANKPAGPDLIRKAIRKEIKTLHEDKGNNLARDLIAKLREKTYRKMSDLELDSFSVDMIDHFLDNYEARAYAKRKLDSKTSRLDTL